MISQTEVFTRVLSEINAAGIEYMIVGSLAASAHGFMRDTHDLDLVVVMSRDSVRVLAGGLGNDFYFDIEGAEQSVLAEYGDVLEKTGVFVAEFHLRQIDYAKCRRSLEVCGLRFRERTWSYKDRLCVEVYSR